MATYNFSYNGAGFMLHVPTSLRNCTFSVELPGRSAVQSEIAISLTGNELVAAFTTAFINITVSGPNRDSLSGLRDLYANFSTVSDVSEDAQAEIKSAFDQVLPPATSIPRSASAPAALGVVRLDSTSPATSRPSTPFSVSSSESVGGLSAGDFDEVVSLD